MSVFASIARFASDYRTRRRRMHTYLELLSLPPEIQKDIGWPTEEEMPRRLERRTRTYQPIQRRLV
ncbi:MAG: hypothetical protein ACT6RL_20225 [Neoaquamicrobium sediminum]|uniref:DUF1127 domain-containing protein n=1 Tax=Neoaquamicrobium sediminum TaxID=1849104 RepID=A0ABV3WXX6_9HYPH|nr:hypothetical protein [Mesorhizobium sp.]